jgi:hypothetical protein
MEEQQKTPCEIAKASAQLYTDISETVQGGYNRSRSGNETRFMSFYKEEYH